MGTNAIEETRCNSAEDFLEVLSPRDKRWGGKPSEWIYRGQDRDLPLLPKAYREGGKHYKELGFEIKAPTDEQPLWSVLADTGELFLKAFRETLDRTGLPVPMEAPRPYSRDTGTRYMSEPEGDVYPQLALAQHLGLPTALLDWSHRAYVGAYFAVPKKDPVDENIVVWALRTPFLSSGYGYWADGCSMKLITAPRSSNPNLHAQSGIFTVLQGEKAPTLDVATFVSRLEANENTPMPAMPLMRKVIIPAGHSSRLLKLLAEHEGIDGSSMFPGFDGIAKAMAEKAIWDRDFKPEPK